MGDIDDLDVVSYAVMFGAVFSIISLVYGMFFWRRYHCFFFFTNKHVYYIKEDICPLSTVTHASDPSEDPSHPTRQALQWSSERR